MTNKILLFISFAFFMAGSVLAQEPSKKATITQGKDTLNLKDSDPANYYLAEGKKKGLNDDYKGAINNFTTALLFNPKSADAFYNRGLAYYYLKSYDSAVADITAAINIDSLKVNYYNQRGICYTTMGNYTEAKKDFNTALRLNPNSPDGNLDMGVMYLSTGNYDEACEYLHKAKKLGSTKAQDAIDVYCKSK